MERDVLPAQTQLISRPLLWQKGQSDWANINISLYSQASLRLDSGKDKNEDNTQKTERAKKVIQREKSNGLV